MAVPEPTAHRSPGLQRRTLLGAGLAGALGLAGCASQRPSSQAKLPAGPDLLVGVCLELTGANAIVGASAQRGIQVALDEVNADGLRVGGKLRKIRLEIRDNKSSPDTAAAMIDELISTQVTAIIGGAVAATSTAMSAVAEQRQVPMISLAAADDIVKPVPKHRFVFKLGPDASNVSDLLMSRLAGVQGAIGVMAESSPHGDAGVAALLDSARAQVPQVNIKTPVRLPLGTVDYRAQAAQIINSRVKEVVIWSQAPTALAAATALKQAGYIGQLYFDTGAAADDAIDLKNNQVMGGARFVAPQILAADAEMANSATNYARQVFFNDFNRRYGPISSYAIFGADAVRMLGAAAERTTDPTRLRVRNGLESAPFYLLGGSYAFSTINHGGVEPDQLTVLELEQAGWRRI